MRIVLGEVEHIDPVARQLAVTELDHPVTISYDSLIVAGGAVTSYFGHDDFRRRASGMKSLDDALYLRGQIFGAFEEAEAETDEERRRALMTFVVVGGGPTGVEMAGQLKELSSRALRRNYRRIDPSQTRVVLVEGGDAAGGHHGRAAFPHHPAGSDQIGHRGPPRGDGHRDGRRLRDASPSPMGRSRRSRLRPRSGRPGPALRPSAPRLAENDRHPRRPQWPRSG